MNFPVDNLNLWSSFPSSCVYIHFPVNLYFHISRVKEIIENKNTYIAFFLDGYFFFKAIWEGWIGFVGCLPRGSFLRCALSSVCFPFLKLLFIWAGVLDIPQVSNMQQFVEMCSSF
jgi:hypothetical protein